MCIRDSDAPDEIPAYEKMEAFVPTETAVLENGEFYIADGYGCLLYTSPSPRDRTRSRMPSSA